MTATRARLIVCAGLLGFALPAAPILAADSAPPQVRVAAGTLAGALPPDAPGAVFKGVPFAAAPVGALRWRAPEPLARWSGVRDATAFAPACIQNGRDGPSGSEDCLYLNIWTPQWPVLRSHPVMLWLFGGANAVGSASNPQFDGAALARRGVVVVTINYRVGVMGFLAHPALAAESAHHSSGNYALLDQLTALRWVHANIAQFGGDPAHVTLFGQSSGSYDLLSLMASPLAKGLFINAIAESGQLLSYGGAMPKARAEAIGSRIATALGAPAGAAVLTYLRALPAAQVVTVAAPSLPTDLDSDTGLLTNVDGWVLPAAPAAVFAAGHELAIPLIIGNNAREISPRSSASELRRQIGAKYGDLAPAALAAYGLADDGQGSEDALLGDAGAQWMTDTVQRCAALLEAAWHAAAGHATWEYQFELPMPGRESAGATHGAEVGFVFGTLQPAGAADSAVTPADRAVAEQLQDYWTRFARTGDPNGGSLPPWPRADAGHYLAFTAAGPVAQTGLQSRACGVFRQWALRQLPK